MAILRLAIPFLALALLSRQAFCQIVILPVLRPRADVHLERYRISGEVADQTARLVLTVELYNAGGGVGEAELLVPLPRGATVHGVTLIDKRRELTGELLEAEEARRKYEEIVRRYLDPVLLEYVDHDLYRVRVFPVPAKGHRRVDVEFSLSVDRTDRTVSLQLPLPRPGRRALRPEITELDLAISDQRGIHSAFCSSPDVQVERRSPHRFVVRGRLTHLPASGLTVHYILPGDPVAIWAQSSWVPNEPTGVVLLFVTPPAELPATTERLAKDVIIVLDRSGSMTGEKLQQAKEAVRFILRRLPEGDRFNVIHYAGDVQAFFDGLRRAHRDAIDEALARLETLRASGGTNIHDALLAAVAMADSRERPAYILFLTDGRPTVGEKSEMKIATEVERSNRNRARIIAFGVGYDVNSRLLDRVTRANHGRTVYVGPEEDLEQAMASLYAAIEAPVLTDLTIVWQGVEVEETYPVELPDLFAGTQLTVVARYHEPQGPVTVTVRGKLRGEEQQFQGRVELAPRGRGLSRAHLYRLWAQRAIGHLIDQLDLEGPNKEIERRIRELARRYAIVTPLTSLFIEEPERPRRRRIPLPLAQAAGAAAFEMRAAKEALIQGLAISGDGSQADRRAAARYAYFGGQTWRRTDSGWVPEGVNEEALAEAETVVIGTDRFFELVLRLPAPVRRVFTLEGPVYVVIGDKLYRFVEQDS